MMANPAAHCSTPGGAILIGHYVAAGCISLLHFLLFPVTRFLSLSTIGVLVMCVGHILRVVGC